LVLKIYGLIYGLKAVFTYQYIFNLSITRLVGSDQFFLITMHPQMSPFSLYIWAMYGSMHLIPAEHISLKHISVLFLTAWRDTKCRMAH